MISPQKVVGGITAPTLIRGCQGRRVCVCYPGGLTVNLIDTRMNLPYLTNLSAHSLGGTFDPTAEMTPLAPPNFGSKDDYRHWCVQKTTNHKFITIGIPVCKNLRSSKENNEVRTIGAVVAEFDAPFVGELDFAKFPYQPTWICRTFSGHMRMWWELPCEVPLDNEAHRNEFLKIFLREVKAIKLAPGFAQDESIDAYRYYEVGYNWKRVAEGSSMSADTIRGWMFRALEGKWPSERSQVPFEEVRKECATRWPNCGVSWETFGPGVRCHRFWDAGADASAAIVTDHGVRCWTGDKTFVGWSELLGADWVRAQTDVLYGSLIKGWYWESKTGKYWNKVNDKAWHSFTQGDFELRLQAGGLSQKAPKEGGLSAVRKAVLMVQETCPVHGIYPAFYNKSDIVSIAHQEYLNTSLVEPQKPDQETNTTWGQGFPWIANYMEKIFRDEQRIYYLHWLMHYYRQALAGKPGRGLALFIAGPVGVGKTFLSRQIHEKLFGGSMDASSYLTRADQFNTNLVSSPMWTIDDAVAQTDAKTREGYSQMIKMMTANEGVVMRGMHREGFRAPWFGRLTVTMNDDPDSLKMLPMTDISIKDKIVVICAMDTGFKHGDWATDAMIDAELPFFAAYLRDIEPDPEIWGGRFGIKAYQDPEIIARSESAGTTAGTKEILEAWVGYMNTDYRDVLEWTGTATELDDVISAYPALHKSLQRQVKSVSDFQHDLRKLHNQGWPRLETIRTGPSRVRAWKLLLR